MKISGKTVLQRQARRFQAAFSLPEVLVGMAITGVAFTALYSGMAFGLSGVRSNAESLRATQIMTEKLDTIRLYAWDKVITPGYIPTTFTVPFAPQDSGLASKGFNGGGFVYYGTTTIQRSPPAFSQAYRTNLCEVEITLVWTNGVNARRTSMKTLVGKNGLQSYVY